MAEKVIVITGASSGLGAGMAEEFFELGHRLALCSRRPPALEESERVFTRRLDISDEAEVDGFAADTVERFGHIDLWINNAGVLEPIRALADADMGKWWRLMEVNLRGVALGSRAFVRYLRARQAAGVLINISSGAAESAYAGWSAYCASKAAVDLLTRCVALEEVDSELRAYAVAPGVIDTQMQEQLRASSPEDFPEREKFLELKRREQFSTPGFVARRLFEIAFESPPDEVVLRLPPE